MKAKSSFQQQEGENLPLKLRVLIAENQPEYSTQILDSLSELKECDFISCNNDEHLLDMAAQIRPELLLIHFDLIQNNYLHILNDLRHLDPKAIIIVYFTIPLEEARKALLMAGATKCILLAPENLNELAGIVKNAVIHISERHLSDGSVQAFDQDFPEIVFSLDLEGRIVYANSAIAHLMGYENEDVMNSDFSEFISNERHRDQFQRFLNGCTEKGAFRGLLTLETALGIEQDFQVSIHLMEGETLCGTAKKIGLGINPIDWKTEQEAENKILEEADDSMQEADPAANDILPSHLGPYRVTSILGEGAMGRVYKGFDEHLERYIAIKMIHNASASNTEHVERFKQEARLLASISHPNIALIYYFDLWNNLPFFCMEYLPEGSVDDLLKHKGVLDPLTAILYVQQVALGLKKAQEKGVVHLDIKPSNLMVAEKNRIKIVDFGLAATFCELQDNSDTIVGTPAYLAPEQLNNGIIDHRCDIYSLGITFFEMLYGILPYSGKNVKDLFAKKLSDDIPGPELLSLDVPMQLYELIRKMVERDPNRRIQQYSELIDKLEECKRKLSGPRSSLRHTKEKSIRSRGNLYDTSFAEVLGNLWKEGFTGRLTLQWLDISKVIHFHQGAITAVLSNQEGERFIDLLISEKHLRPDAAWKIQTSQSGLFTKYSSAMELVGQQNRESLNVEFLSLSWKILESLFSWVSGEFIIEEGPFPEQAGIQIAASEVIAQGVRHHTDSLVISRKLLHGKIKIVMSTQCSNRLRQVSLTASERFLLLKTDKELMFSELHTLSNLPEEEFSRLIYLFISLGLVEMKTNEVAVVKDEKPKRETINPDSRPAQQKQPELEEFELAKGTPVDVPTGIEMKESLTSMPPPDLVDEYCRQAAEDYSNGQYWSSVQHCKNALTYREDFRIYHLMGKALAKHSGFKHDAMKALKTALELNPSNIAIQKDIADLYLMSDNIALAIAHYKKILAMHPNDKHCKERLSVIAHRNDITKVVGRTLGKLFNGGNA